MKVLAPLLVLFVGFSALADEKVPPSNVDPQQEAPPQNMADKLVQGAQKASDVMIEAYRNTSEAALFSRQNYSATLLISYSPLELLLPSKIGATAVWHRDANTLYELDFAYSSIKASIESADLSSMNETRISLLKRNFGGGAFHWFWGFNYNSTNAHINELLMGTAGGSSDVITVQTLGMTVGVGHRWALGKDFSVGVDWFSWAQPLYILKKEAPFLDQTTNSEYKDDIDVALKVIGYFPRWAAFKMYLGYSF